MNIKLLCYIEGYLAWSEPLIGPNLTSNAENLEVGTNGTSMVQTINTFQHIYVTRRTLK